jgi:hypothetical protein
VPDDNAEPLAQALRHREAVHRLVDQLREATTPEEVEWIRSEMVRIATEYEASLQATTQALRAENDQLAAKLRELQNDAASAERS